MTTTPEQIDVWRRMGSRESPAKAARNLFLRPAPRGPEEALHSLKRRVGHCADLFMADAVTHLTICPSGPDFLFKG